MITSEIEFAFLKLCFDSPTMWIYRFVPIDPLAKWVVNKVGQFQTEYSKYPNLETFLAYSQEDCGAQQYEYIKQKLITPKLDKDFTEKSVINFIENTNIRNAAKKALSLAELNKTAEAKMALLEGTEILYNPPVNYFESHDIVDPQVVSVGFRTLDRPLGGGGQRKSLFLVIAPSGVGKSLTMLNIGAIGAHRGDTVIHITVEDSELQVRRRYDRRFEHFDTKATGKLFIQECISGKATVADFDSIANSYRPDIVIVDHINEVGVAKSTGNTSKDLGDIARGLKAIAQRYNCLMVTAQQGPKRKKFSEEDVTAEDGFWSYEPTQIADAVITLNQTREERVDNKLRINLEKNRNGIANISLPFNVSYEKMLLEEHSPFLSKVGG